MEGTIRLVIVDDHTLFRRGLVSLLSTEPDLEVVGEAESGEEAVALVQRLQPDVVLMDLRMPGMGGVEAIRRVLEVAPRARVLVLTVSEEDEDLSASLRAGARGYLLKNAEAGDLVSAIRRVHRGQGALSPEVALRLVRWVQEGWVAPAQDVPPLTPREWEVARLLAQGASTQEIAHALTVSENTVKTHIHNMIRKLGLQNRGQLVAFARQRLNLP